MDIKIYSETPPDATYTGRIWIKPSTATAYMKLGSTWVTLGSAGDVVDYQNVTVWLDGVDITRHIKKNTLSIEDILTKEVNTCMFALEDPDDFPRVGQECIVYYRASEVATPEIIFAGYIEEAPQERIAHDKYVYDVTCSDYTQELNKRNVTEVYESMSAGDIIKDIINNYATSLGTYYVQDGPTVDYIAFNYKYPLECIEEICELTGYDFYVDYQRNIHFFSSETYEAPYELDETSSSGDYKDLVITINKSELQNVATVRGGYELSDLYTQEEVADGVQESFTLRYKPYAPISVYVDVGGGYSQKTVGIDNIDPTGTDFVVNVSEKVIKNSDYAVLSSGHKIKVTYKYKKPILAYKEDYASIAAMIEYEGGDGIHEAPLIVDDTIETKEQARARAEAQLLDNSNPIVEGTFITTQHGYKSGQILTINLPSRNINNRQYLIQEVASTSLGMGKFEYEVTFATKLKGLTDYLIQLHKDSRKVFERTDEILDLLKRIDAESFIVDDDSLTKALRNTTSSPFKWSNDAGTTTGKGQWNKASWG